MKHGQNEFSDLKTGDAHTKKNELVLHVLQKINQKPKCFVRTALRRRSSFRSEIHTVLFSDMQAL